jgi:hypothetical protein
MSESAKVGRESPFLSLEQEIETALEAGQVGIWRWRIGSDQLGWTRNLEALHRLPAGSFDGTFESFAGDIDPYDYQRVMEAVQAVVEKGGAYEIRYRNRPRDAREPIWIEARGRVVEPGDGHRYMTGVCQNATERINAQLQLERRLRQQQAVAALGSYALAEDSLPRILRRAVDVAAESARQQATPALRDTDGIGVVQFVSPGDRLLAGAMGLVRIAEMPKRPASKDERHRAWIVSELQAEVPMRVRVVQRQRLLQQVVRLCEPTAVVPLQRQHAQYG